MSKDLNELIQELGKLVDGYKNTAEELDKLKSLYEKLKLETAEECEYPFQENENYWFVGNTAAILRSCWHQDTIDIARYEMGNAFSTEEAAQKELEKRTLLTRFRQFRDKCNGDWKPDFKDSSKDKYIIYYDYEFRKFYCCNLGGEDEFHLFGYFKIRKDCERAIELFGAEIIRLWVEK